MVSQGKEDLELEHLWEIPVLDVLRISGIESTQSLFLGVQKVCMSRIGGYSMIMCNFLGAGQA